jgi:hypothetical protein
MDEARRIASNIAKCRLPRRETARNRSAGLVAPSRFEIRKSSGEIRLGVKKTSLLGKPSSYVVEFGIGECLFGPEASDRIAQLHLPAFIPGGGDANRNVDLTRIQGAQDRKQGWSHDEEGNACDLGVFLSTWE